MRRKPRRRGASKPATFCIKGRGFRSNVALPYLRPRAQTPTVELRGKKQRAAKKRRETEILRAYGAVRRHRGVDAGTDLLSPPRARPPRNRVRRTKSLPALRKKMLQLDLKPVHIKSVERTDSTRFVDGVLTINGLEFCQADLCPLERQIGVKDFVNLGTLGRGSCGVVYKVWDIPASKLVALKCIGVRDRDSEKRGQILQELETFKRYPQARHNVEYYGAYFHDDHIWLSLQYCACGSLDAVVQRFGPLATTEVRAVLTQLLQGLHDLHSQNLVHRDIKPANLLLTESGEVKITDFGILEKLGDSQETKAVIGTHLYMSPARLKGKPYSYGCDVWSLGLTAIVLTTGRLPFERPEDYSTALARTDVNFADLALRDATSLNPDLRDFISLCLKVDAKARPSVEELMDHSFITVKNSKTAAVDWERFLTTPLQKRIDDCSRICSALMETESAVRPKDLSELSSELNIPRDTVKDIYIDLLMKS